MYTHNTTYIHLKTTTSTATLHTTVRSHNFDSQNFNLRASYPGAIAYVYIYIYICIHVNIIRMYIYIYIYKERGRERERERERRPRGAACIKEPLLTSTSRRPLEAQISQGLGPSFQIELLKAGRRFSQHAHVYIYIYIHICNHNNNNNNSNNNNNAELHANNSAATST